MQDQIDVVIFDLDGTLIDSKNDIAGAFNQTLLHFGLAPLPLSLIVQHVGTGVRPLLIEAVEKSKHVEAKVAVQYFEETYLANCAKETTLYTGIAEVLDTFSTKPMVIVTNKAQRFIQPILQSLDVEKYFAHVFGREAFAASKPNPEPIKKVAELFKVPTKRVVMIGDTTVDMTAGKAAGAKTCACLWGYGIPDDLRISKPTWSVQFPMDLVKIWNEGIAE